MSLNQGEELNWDYVINIAKEHRIGGIVYRILLAINEKFGGQVPADVLSQLKDNGVVISINDVLSSIKVGDQNLNLSPPNISKISLFCWKTHCFFKKHFPHREFMIHNHSIVQPERVYFYYFIPVGQFIIKLAKTLHQLPIYLWNKRLSRRAYADR